MYPHIKSRLNKYIVYFVFTALAALLLPHFRHSINPDGISYIQIAKEYASGDVKTAVNATWSPMFPLLLVPIIMTGIDPLLSVKILQILLGFLFLYSCDIFLGRLKLRPVVKSVSIFTLIPLTLYFVFSSVSADLLIMSLLIFYLMANGLAAGLIGGLSYLARTYAFAFFVIHFSIINIFKKTVAGNFIRGILIFAVISSFWIFLLYQKYHKSMIGSASYYGLAIQNPVFKNAPEHSLFSLGPIPPPNDKSISAWDDLTYTLPLFPGWNPFGSIANFSYFLRLILSNLLAMIYSFGSFSIIFLVLPIFYLLSFRKIKSFFPVHFLALTGLVYALGFLPFEYVERHIWFSVVIFFFLITYFINSFIVGHPNIKYTNILILLLFATFLIKPLFFFLLDNSEGLYTLSQSLRSKDIKGNLISNKFGSQGIVFAYFLDSRYFGVDNVAPKAARISQLKKLGINYYFFWKINATSQISQDLENTKVFENNDLVVLRL